jgi:hypothetical protein
MPDLEELAERSTLTFVSIGAAIGAVIGLVNGFIDAGIGGAIVYAVGGAIFGAILGGMLPGLLIMGVQAVSIGALIAIVVGVIWVISKLWNVGKP